MASTPSGDPPPDRPQPKFLVTYGTGGIKSSNRLRVISLAKLHQYLVARHYVATAALNELWHPFTYSTSWQRKQQHELLESSFPFVIAAAVYDEKADLVDEEDDHTGWQTLSGLVVLAFTYPFTRGNEKRTATNRKRLQKLLLNSPLLGPSIVLMFKEPGECRLYVLVAAGAMSSYSARVRTITTYLKAVCPELYRSCFGADIIATTPCTIGNDPQAWLRQRPAGGYALFPVKRAKAETQESERQRLAGLSRQRSHNRNKR